MPRAQPLGERVVALAQGVRRPRRRGDLHREAALTDRGAGEERYTEPERFCGKLALENKILKKGAGDIASAGDFYENAKMESFFRTLR
jgi:hypothetical protein